MSPGGAGNEWSLRLGKEEIDSLCYSPLSEIYFCFMTFKTPNFVSLGYLERVSAGKRLCYP